MVFWIRFFSSSLIAWLSVAEGVSSKAMTGVEKTNKLVSKRIINFMES